MANQKISELSSAGALTGAELFVVAQSGSSVSVDVDTVAAFLDADTIPFSSATGGLVSTTVGDALRELQDEITDLAAEDITFSSTTGGLSSTNVGDALRELEDELIDHIGSTSAHDADDITFSSVTGGLSSDNAGDALRELQDDIANLDADDIAFSSTTGGLTSTTVGDALRELQDDISQSSNTVILTTPESLSFTVTGAWTTVNNTTLANAQAIAAIVKVEVRANSGSAATTDKSQSYISLRETGSGLSAVAITRIVYVRAECSVVGEEVYDYQVGTLEVPLDASYDFDYFRIDTLSGGGGVTYEPYLIGYIT